ncbi:MAG: hypothetical protein WD065_13470 [Planctomycetaceae bacterium]
MTSQDDRHATLFIEWNVMESHNEDIIASLWAVPFHSPEEEGPYPRECDNAVLILRKCKRTVVEEAAISLEQLLSSFGIKTLKRTILDD